MTMEFRVSLQCMCSPADPHDVAALVEQSQQVGMQVAELVRRIRIAFESGASEDEHQLVKADFIRSSSSTLLIVRVQYVL